MNKLTQVITIAAVTAAIALIGGEYNVAFSLASRSGKSFNTYKNTNNGSYQNPSHGTPQRYQNRTTHPLSPGNDKVKIFRPDLVIVGIPRLCTTDPKGGFLTIRNVGMGPSNPFSTSIRFLPNHIRTVKIASLKPGQAVTVTRLFRPTGFGDGSQFEIWVDSGETNRESNENNNRMSSTCIL